MIVTASILQGIQIITGPLLHHMALLVAMISIKIPDSCHISPTEKTTTNHPRLMVFVNRGNVIFFLIILMHITNSVQKFVFTFEFAETCCVRKETTFRFNKICRVFINFFQLILFSIMAFTWVFSHEQDPNCNGDAPDEKAWTRFKFFMVIECLVFIANVFGAMVYMFFRSFAHNQLMWDIEENDKWEETDAIIMNLEQIDLLQQMFTPAFVSLIYITNNKVFQDFSYSEEEKSVQHMVLAYTIFQCIQLLLTIIVMFVNNYIYDGSKTWNNIAPKVLWVFA